MFRGRRHPNDDALLRWYLADRGLEALEARDEVIVSHVAACERCAQRYERLCLDLDGAAEAVVASADAAFSAEQLLQQRERIMRRIDSPSARVLAFPAHDAAGRQGGRLPAAWRWVAAAAVAGLLVGLAAGRMWHLGVADPFDGTPEPAFATRSIGPAANGQIRPATLGAADDSFLSEVDTALSAPGTPELEAIDAMTLRTQSGPPLR